MSGPVGVDHIPPPLEAADRPWGGGGLLAIMALTAAAVLGGGLFLLTKGSSPAHPNDVVESDLPASEAWSEASVEDYYSANKERWNRPLEFPESLGIPEE